MRPTPPSCPACRSTNIGEAHYVGGSVLWFVCPQCSHVWAAPPATDPATFPDAA
jgi:hypothetical protein